MFEAYYDPRAVTGLIRRDGKFPPFPKYDDREAWDRVPSFLREQFTSDEVKKALADYVPECALATQYMEYYRTGGERCDPHTGGRRTMLLNALMLECFEHTGKYIDTIIDLAWLICEETSWVVPPHANHMHNYMYTGKMKNALPDITETNFIDLASAGCAAIIGYVYHCMKERLDEESPLICKRIEYEIRRRIIVPFMTHDDLTWFGFHGHKINNWNPWILENIIPVCMEVIKGEDERAEFFARALEKLDIYINKCTTDGAGDEGPSYWNESSGNMVDLLEMIRDITDGRIDMLRDDFTKRCCEYIAHASIAPSLYANFADGIVENRYGYDIYRYAKLVGSEYLLRYALSSEETFEAPQIRSATFYRSFKTLFEYLDPNTEKKEPFVHRDVWLADAAQLFVRTDDDHTALSVKGGHNDESHNHNDLGSFIYDYMGEPILCDPGPLHYTARAFSPFRYEYWIVNSDAHNCAGINGFSEHAGEQYRTETVGCTLGEKEVSLTFDLRDAFERKAGLVSYLRSYRFEKETGKLTVTDEIETAGDGTAEVHFVTELPVEFTEDGVILTAKSGARFRLVCPGGRCSVEEHYDMRLEKEHSMRPYAGAVPGKDGCELLRVVFSFDTPANTRRIVSQIERLD